MRIGYARVSTIGQSLDSQVEQLTKYGCEKIYHEKQTGKSTKTREELKRCIEELRSGDELVVVKIDRLARSIIDLNKLVQELITRGVSVTFIKENMTFAHEGHNAMHNLLFNMLGSFAQFERELIVERTTEGRQRAINKGKHMGRPSQPKNKINLALKLYNDRDTTGNSVSDIVKITGVPRATIYHELKKI
jgi:DNA invertase Pin-like site-specific DNA recombinase